jgi:carboxylesterase
LAIIKGAEPFLLLGGDQGVLLIHGFTGAPAEVRLLGEYLHNKGFTVLAPRLCGHGTTVEEMSKTKWSHWYSAAEDGYHILKSLCKGITVVGLSMGGLLALKLGAEYPIDKLVSLSTPIYIVDKRVNMLPMYRMFREFVPKKRKVFMDIDPQYSVGYNATPLSSLSSLIELIQHVNKLLPSITAPLLIIQARSEHTVQPRSASYIYDKVGSEEKKLIWLEKSGHIVTLDVDRDQVFKEITEWIIPHKSADRKITN